MITKPIVGEIAKSISPGVGNATGGASATILSSSFAAGLPSGWTFTRAGGQYYVDSSGVKQWEASSNVPAFNYKWNGSAFVAQGLVVESTHENLIIRSEDLSDTAWTKGDFTIIDAMAEGPDGLLTATEIAADAGASTKLYYQTATVATTSGAPAIYSFDIKANGLDFVKVLSSNNINGAGWANFDFTTGDWGSVSGFNTFPPEVMANGWYRLTVIEPTALNSSGGSWYLSAINTDTAERISSYSGDGVAGYIVTKASARIGSGDQYPVSHTPTTGAAATSPLCLLKSTLSETLGTDFSFHAVVRIGHDKGAEDDAERLFSINTGDEANRLEFYLGTAGAIGVIKTLLTVGVASSTLSAATWSAGDTVSIRGRQDASGVHWWIDGEAKKTETGATWDDAFSTELDTAQIGNTGNDAAASALDGNAVECTIWNEAKDDAFLAALV